MEKIIDELIENFNHTSIVFGMLAVIITAAIKKFFKTICSALTKVKEEVPFSERANRILGLLYYKDCDWQLEKHIQPAGYSCSIGEGLKLVVQNIGTLTIVTKGTTSNPHRRIFLHDTCLNAYLTSNERKSIFEQAERLEERLIENQEKARLYNISENVLDFYWAATSAPTCSGPKCAEDLDEKLKADLSNSRAEYEKLLKLEKSLNESWDPPGL